MQFSSFSLFLKLIIFSLFFVYQGISNAQFFTRVTDAGPIVTDSVLRSGGSWTDINNDGLPDLFACGDENSFYQNNGDGTFTKILNQPFVSSDIFAILGVWGDYNNDSYEDLYLLNYTTPANAQAPNVLYKNSGPPDFNLDSIDVGSKATLSPSGSWVDYDRDGDLDLFVVGEANTADIFYRNDGNDVFTIVDDLPFLKTNRPGSANQDVWIDYDNDSDLDLYIKKGSSRNQLFKSLFAETGNPDLFDEVSDNGLLEDGGIFDVGSSWGDYDNDGDFDMFLAVSGVFGQGLADHLYENNGDGTFTRNTTNPIVTTVYNTSYGAWGDYDNDGDIDLFVAEVGLGFSKTKLFRNEGSGNFVNIDSSEVGEIIIDLPRPQSGHWEDYDNDGDLDLYSLNYSVAGKHQPGYLIRNNLGNNNNWLTVKCAGDASNKSGIGTRVKVKANINGSSYWQIRYINGGTSSFAFQTMKRAHFGLGGASIVDSIIVDWPSGIRQVLTNVSVNQFLTINEDVPTGYLRTDFTADVFLAVNTDTLTVHFTDKSFSVPGFPVTSWQWDFNGNGIIDSNNPSQDWTYNAAGLYDVTLIAGNGTLSDTLTRRAFINVTGLVPIIDVNTANIGLGLIPANNPQVDRTFYIYNIGGGSDSIYITVDPHNVNPPTAISIFPESFDIAPYDSQAVVFTVYPPQIIPSSSFSFPKAIIDSRFGYGTTQFVKQFSFKITDPVSVNDEAKSLPTEFHLYSNYPNPFNPSTVIKYDLPEDAIVELKVYDILGREIGELVNGELPASSYSINFVAENLSSGIYIYRITAVRYGEILFSSSRKMILLK